MVDPQPTNRAGEAPTENSAEEPVDRDWSLKEAQLAIAREELALKKREVELKEQEHKDSRWLNPVFLGLVAATLTLLGNIYVTHQQSTAANLQTRAKAQSDLILEAIKTGDTTKAAKNLQFFVQLGFIDDPNGKIASYLATGKDIPVLPSDNGGSRWGASNITIFKPVAKLAPDSIERVLSNSVGMIKFGEGSCTAWLVRSDMIITADYCIPTGMQIPALFVLGYLSADSPGLQIRVSPTPVETDKTLGYAILRLEKPVDRQEHPPVLLATREPKAGEPIFLLHHPSGGPMQISTDAEQCKVVTLSPESPNEFSHSCATVGGSSGAPIISAVDFQVIGIHYGKDAKSNLILNLGKKASTIRKKSKVLSVP